MKEPRILLIDDEQVPQAKQPTGGYMWYYSYALREHGFLVLEVIGPDEAISALCADDAGFDLVLLDIMMPPGKTFEQQDTVAGLRTGILLADKLRELAPDVPIVVLTNVENTQAHQAMLAKPNVRRLLTKPKCTPFQLVAEVRLVLGV